MADSDLKHSIVIFCDGACSGNPGPGGWGAIVVTPQGTVSELGGSSPHTTNNQMELTATIESLLSLKKTSGEIIVCTDSTYVIRGITEWIWGWRKRGWKSAEGKDVMNRELWEKLSEVVSQREPKQIKWKYVRGHVGIPGNERADAIAVGFSKGETPSLYQGSLDSYEIAIHELPQEGEIPKTKSSGGKTAAAHSYLSLIGDLALRHKSWPECEKRVKGQSGAKFKKAMSADEEKAILLSWGIDPKTLK